MKSGGKLDIDSFIDEMTSVSIILYALHCFVCRVNALQLYIKTFQIFIMDICDATQPAHQFLHCICQLVNTSKQVFREIWFLYNLVIVGKVGALLVRVNYRMYFSSRSGLKIGRSKGGVFPWALYAECSGGYLKLQGCTCANTRREDPQRHEQKLESLNDFVFSLGSQFFGTILHS